MRVQEAKNLIVAKMQTQIRRHSLQVMLDETSPDPSDPGKFTLQARTARAIHRFDGWHVPIQLSWLDNSDEPPRIKGEPFYWYAFAVPVYSGFREPSYFVCDYRLMKKWVLEFDAPLGDTHRDHQDWRADIRPYHASASSGLAYFRWGDEPLNAQSRLSRIIRLDNVADITLDQPPRRLHDSVPESEAHRRLKLYVASSPSSIGLQGTWTASVEHHFTTGDTVDILFRSPTGKFCAVEIEVDGAESVTVGTHQAIKYRALAASHAGLPLSSPDISACVVAFQTDYLKVRDLSARYNIRAVSIRRRDIFE